MNCSPSEKTLKSYNEGSPEIKIGIGVARDGIRQDGRAKLTDLPDNALNSG
ncbi:MAG: hypothetical protein PHP44_00050 [Kiritimatiellae bacterium]|nr:hypothetical protein [Kiritimatiellia bacterium]MDD4734476.1 hypothetical protein [Kiritimatiellia bacterium]